MTFKRILRITLMLWALFFMFQGFCQSDPPVVTADGNQIYCPQTQQNIVTSFNIVDTDSNSIDAFYIQVSSGYVLGEDQLILTGSHPNVTSSWNAAEAKLTLSPASGSTILYTDIINAVYDVIFISNNLNVGPKTFSLTVGEANFLDGHYYDFVPSYAIPWTTAKANAEAMSYYGLQGYLATITNADEAQICGELSPGTGWIGASDAESESIWKWVTGPEEGTIFWNGNQNGSAPTGMYSNWNAGEPNNYVNNEDYAHITDVSVTTNPGSWNDLPDSTAGQPPQYTATGFVVEYGGMPGDPQLSISASTAFSPAEILSTTPSTSCENETANLEATSNTTGILWFDNEFGGNLLHSGNTYNPVLSSNEIFWVLASENGCQTGIRVAINATVTPNETITIAPINPICQGDPNPLPNEIDGITGTWNPAFDATTTTEYTFTPDTGPCVIPPAPIEVVVNPLITPNVVPINPICQGDPNPLPNEIDGITGTWNPAFDATTTTEYTFIPDAGQCAIPPAPIEVVVNPLITPNVVPINPICQGDPNPLPNEIDGITGTWNPAFDATTTTEYTFTPDAGQCAIPPAPIEVVVNPLITPNVVPINPICQGDPNPLPNEIDGITGTWNPAFDATTTTEYTFTPDAGQCAIPPAPIEVVVNPLITPNVVPINPICQGDPNPLPNEIDGITGTWNPAFDATTTTEYTFIPDAGQCAIPPAPIEVVVNPLITPNVVPINPICQGDPNPLPNEIDGITGTWNPAFDATTTTEYTFTPDAGQCAIPPAPIEVVVNPLITPNVVPINPICQGDPNPLPNEIDGITGTWNPAFDATTTTEYTFIPDAGQCAIPPAPIEVVVNPLITPNVVPINPICQGDPNPLPNEIDGITGTWNPAFDATTTTEYTFIPTISGCYEEVTLEVTVLQQITPTFQIDDICIGETIPPLLDFSQEGITGTWSPAINNLATTTYTFTPDPGQCADIIEETIQVKPINTLAIITENTSAPFESNQIIEVTVTGGSGNYEYQLDGGNWQTSSMFQNVIGCQDHIVKVRDAEGCSNEPESTVTILSYPKFFTPNGDGFNDFWNIKCLRNSAGLVSIFDRFGKLLKQFKTTGSGWNGTYNNNLMPTSDYWFLVTYYDENGIEKEFKSHFTLRR